MKNLRIFNSMEEFEAVKSSIDTPFVVLEEGTGDVIYSNLTEISEDDITGGDYVDLGLPSGLKWATCNVGATKPCEYGLLYQFGRVDGYAYGDVNHQFRKGEVDTYTPNTTSGKKYFNYDVLGKEDDAAYVASNGAMRMPKNTEMEELLNNTTNEWVSCSVMGGEHTSHNVMGRLFTSKTDSSKTLFLPATGNFNGVSRSFMNAGSASAYWCSTVNYTNTCGDVLLCNSSNCQLFYIEKRFGNPIRGVLNNK